MDMIIIAAIAATALFTSIATAVVVHRDGYRRVPSRTA